MSISVFLLFDKFLKECEQILLLLLGVGLRNLLLYKLQKIQTFPRFMINNHGKTLLDCPFDWFLLIHDHLVFLSLSFFVSLY